MWLWILLALIAAIIYLVLTSYNSLQRKAHDIKEVFIQYFCLN